MILTIFIVWYVATLLLSSYFFIRDNYATSENYPGMKGVLDRLSFLLILALFGAPVFMFISLAMIGHLIVWIATGRVFFNTNP